MCGIVGLMGIDFQINHRDIFNQLLYMDALRGMHGTGVVEVHKNRTVKYMKRAIASIDFLDLKSYDKFRHVPVNDLRLILGHNRHATSGGISNESSHPFQHGPITMVHNGSLRTQYNLPEHTRFKVDSENICFALAEIGTEETIKKLNGSFSLVWYNSDENTVNFIRNDERPMFIGKVKGGKSFVFGSEKYMLMAAADRNAKELENIFKTEVLTHYTFDLTNDSFEMTTRKLEGHSFQSYQRPENNRRSQRHAANISRTPRLTTTELLEKVGLKMNQTIAFYLDSFTPFSALNPNKGILTGWMLEDPWERVIIYSAEPPKDGLDQEAVAQIAGYRDVLDTKTEECGVVCDPRTLIVGEAAKGKKPTAEAEKGNPPVKPKQELILRGTETEVDEEIAETVIHLSNQKAEARFHYHNDKQFTGPNGILLTGKQFDDMVKDGCSCCTGNIFASQHRQVEWVDSRTPICPECVAKNKHTVH